MSRHASSSYNKPALTTIVKHNVFWKVLFPVTVAFHIFLGVNLVLQLEEYKTATLHEAEERARFLDEYVQNILECLRICSFEITLSITHGETRLQRSSTIFLDKYFYNISLLDLNGKFISFIYPAYINTRHLSLPYGTNYNLMSGTFFDVTAPYYSIISRTIVWGIRYYNLPDYVLVGEVNLRKFWQLADLNPHSGGLAFYVDNYGNYIIHPDFSKVSKQENLSTSWFKTIKNKGFVFGKYEGSWFLISGKFSPYTNTWCVALRPLNSVLFPMLKLYTVAVLSFIIFLLVHKSLVKQWLTRNIVQPLESFSDFISKYEDTSWDELHSQDFFPFAEGNLLEKSFYKTIARLRDREQALKDSEAKYRTLFETANDAIFILENDKFVDCNVKTMEMFNCDKSDLIGKSPWEMSPKKQPDGASSIEKAREKISKVSEGIPQRFEWVHKRCDGSHFFTEVSLSPLPYGGKSYVQAIVRDITERKEFERALKESEQNFRSLVETAPVGIMVFQKDRFIFVNPEVERATGYQRDELLSIKPFWRIVDEKYHSTVKDIVHKCQAQLESLPILKEIEIITKSGRKRIIRCVICSITMYDKPAGIITAMDMTVLREIENRKRELEQMLYRCQRLESLGTLVAGVAHEFNNLLQAIMLNIEHLKALCERTIRTKTLDASACNEYFQNVKHLYDRARFIIKELLTFSRGEKTNGARKIKLSLHNEINHIVSICKSTFPASIEISTSFNAESDLILAETGLIEQVLLNVLNNARDAILEKAPGGHITISTRNVEFNDLEFSTRSSYRYILVTIEDDGIGIEPKNINKIFDPFFTTKPPDKGTGLGLSVVYGIVTQLGGFIKCESKKGKGTKFHLYFPVLDEVPLDRASVRRAETEDQPLSPLDVNARILIVEDEQFIGQLMQSFLSGFGFDVTHYTTPEEALKSIDESGNNYDLIITDLGLPGMGGEEFIKAVRARNLNMPIIVITGYLTSTDTMNNFVKNFGVVNFLFKPFSTEELKNVVFKALQ